MDTEKMFRVGVLTLCVILSRVSPLVAAEPTAVDRIARLVSTDFRNIDTRRVELRNTSLPPRALLAHCPALGYHSLAASSPSSLRWVQIDLGKRQPLDTVAILPAAGPHGDADPGYFFPRKMRVELADRADLADSVTVADIEVAKGDRPVVLAANGRSARYVRITATHLAARGQLHFFVLGEVLVLSGNRNVAAGQPVTGSDSVENAPVWGLRNLTDGQGIVGPPMCAKASPSNGYHANISPVPAMMKWVQVDLGAELPLDEIRLVPARPRDFADRSGFGFPVRFKVEVSADSEFVSPTVLLDATTSDYPNPGDGLVVIPTPRIRGRVIRITATHLWERTGDYVFALAELQVYSNGTNVGRTAHVMALDSIERGLWSKAFLVDGFASQNQLIEWPEWAANEHRLAEREAELSAIETAWEAARANAYRTLGTSASWIGFGGVLIVIGLIWRGRVLRRREAERLRDRIALDLHDEVGSNLGGILLLAQAGDASDLPEISRITQRTAESLRDLVWLMGRGPDNSADLLAKLRESAAGLLRGVDLKFDAQVDCLPTRVSLEFTRQVFLAFKEILHNIAKHAMASTVSVRGQRVGNRFVLEVQDNGRGFDLQQVTAGTGLRGLRFRAETLGGELTINTLPGKGTTVRLDVPLR